MKKIRVKTDMLKGFSYGDILVENQFGDYMKYYSLDAVSLHKRFVKNNPDLFETIMEEFKVGDRVEIINYEKRPDLTNIGTIVYILRLPCNQLISYYVLRDLNDDYKTTLVKIQKRSRNEYICYHNRYSSDNLRLIE